MEEAKREEARAGLLSLLAYSRELCTEPSKSSPPPLLLPGHFGVDDGAPVLYEPALRKLTELKRANGEPVLWLPADDPLAKEGEDRASVWLRLHRPDLDDVRASAVGQQACAVYAALFTTHQEALREGKGAQLTVGVGQVRWKIDDSTTIDHPLVTLPAVRASNWPKPLTYNSMLTRPVV